MEQNGNRKYKIDLELGTIEDRQGLSAEDFAVVRSDQEKFKQSQSLEYAVTAQCTLQPYANNAATAELVDGGTRSMNMPDTVPRIWSHRNSHIKRLNTQLLEAIEDRDIKEVERLLRGGASPNATCRLGSVSACHLAALSGGEAIAPLLKFGALNNRRDECGRRPLHLAAWSGVAKGIDILLNFSDGLRDKVDGVQFEKVHIYPRPKEMVNVQCDVNILMELPEAWEDSIVHNCGGIMNSFPAMEIGWTPLHAASANAHPDCAHLLLDAGADPNIQDIKGRTPLDVAGFAFYHGERITAERFREVIETLLKTGRKSHCKQFQSIQYYDSPLHTAIELANLDALKELLDAGASVTCLNRDGQTPLHLCVKKRLRKHLQVLLNHNDAYTLSATPLVDMKDKDGYSVLHAAVKGGWLPGVRVALESGANIISVANDGESPIHSAAALGDLDILSEVLSIAKENNLLDTKNKWGETALFIAVVNGQLECLKKILNAGASAQKAEFANKHILHEAAFRGHFDILQVLLDQDESTVEYMFKYKQDLYLWSPEHFAIINNHVKCFNALFSKHIEIRRQKNKTSYDASLLLITAANYNSLEIAERIISYDRMTVHARNEGLTPFKVALYQDSRDVLKLLLHNGINLSTWHDDVMSNGSTAINSIMCILKKPKDFLQNILDKSIYKNDCDFQDPICRIIVTYRILTTDAKTEQMKILKALLETGNEHGQRRLLLHPVVESFLYLKWVALSTFFYSIILLTGLFVFSLNIFVISFFYYEDTGKSVPGFLHAAVWKYMVYVTASLIGVLECMNTISVRKFSLGTSFKFTSIGLAVAIPSIITAKSLSDSEWPRHVATVALMNSWLEMMILLSQTPYWGYYVLMFRKVASKVIKILLTFLFVVIAFAFSFTIQFHSKKPFEDPWAAFVKTIVMMTSEFDYKDTFDPNNAEEMSASILGWRILFLVFVILTAIVLMNLMVGVAVTDLHNLVLKRQQKRVEDLIIFLDSLEGLANHRLMPSFLKRRRIVDGIFRITPSEPNTYKHIPIHIIQAILNMVQAQDLNVQAKQEDNDSQRCMDKLDEINKKLVEVSMDINAKIEQMSLEIKTMKQVLNGSK